MSNLLSCLFCGGKARLYISEDNFFRILCDEDTCEIEPATPYKDTEEEVIHVWNTRA